MLRMARLLLLHRLIMSGPAITHSSRRHCGQGRGEGRGGGRAGGITFAAFLHFFNISIIYIGQGFINYMPQEAIHVINVQLWMWIWPGPGLVIRCVGPVFTVLAVACRSWVSRIMLLLLLLFQSTVMMIVIIIR